MALDRPFRRTFRQHANGSYRNSGVGEYVRHPRYADFPEQYVRSFLLFQKDLLSLFDYIEPSDVNLRTYSYRVHELIVRACVEVEANFKAILRENGYSREGWWNLKEDYSKLEATHRLSGYAVRFPVWWGGNHTRAPFAEWNKGRSLSWYQEYNAVKHDRQGQFANANFENLTTAVSGLVALLASQFGSEDYSREPAGLLVEGPNDGFDSVVGGYFRVRYPEWPEEERYGFDWQQLKGEADPFSKHTW